MTNELLQLEELSKSFAFAEADTYELPSRFHIELAHRVGQGLAKQLGADAQIVSIGTYLMDCMLGAAYSEGKMTEHVALAVQKADELLSQFEKISDEVRTTIRACIQEHHGVPSFSTLEAEICCNADCYRFASVEGFVGGVHNSRKMEVPALVALYSAKANEKWSALSLDVCREELRPQYAAIKKLVQATV